MHIENTPNSTDISDFSRSNLIINENDMNSQTKIIGEAQMSTISQFGCLFLIDFFI